MPTESAGKASDPVAAPAASHEDGRYQAKCNTPPCRHNNLGSCSTPEEAAQEYLQHYQKEHPEELKKERARLVMLPVQEHLLIRSDKNKSGYKGVFADKGRYKAICNTPPCLHNHLGMFGTPEEAAQVYLQHWEKKHSEELNVAAAPPRAPDSVGASALSTANNRVTSLLQMRKKRQLQQSMAETVHLSVQLADANQALKRCKKESEEAVHADVQRMVSAVEPAVAQCNICCGAMPQASSMSGCRHTFCRSCIEESVTGCCPECHVPAWQQDTIVNAVVEVANAACTSALPGAILLNP
jgi:hypothetical protein